MKVSLKHGALYMTKVRGAGWLLESVIVDPEHRGSGIGTRLMKRALQKSGRPVYLLATSELGGDAKRLVSFYERFGFEKAKQRKRDGLGFNYNMVLW